MKIEISEKTKATRKFQVGMRRLHTLGEFASDDAAILWLVRARMTKAGLDSEDEEAVARSVSTFISHVEREPACLMWAIYFHRHWPSRRSKGDDGSSRNTSRDG